MDHRLLATGHSTHTAQTGCSVQRQNKRHPPKRMVQDGGWQPAAPISLWSLPPAAGRGRGAGHAGFQPWHQPVGRWPCTTRREHAGCRLVVTVSFSRVHFSGGKSQVVELECRQQRVLASKRAGGASGASALAVTSPCCAPGGSASNPPPSSPIRGVRRFAIPGLPKLLLSVPAGPTCAAALLPPPAVPESLFWVLN